MSLAGAIAGPRPVGTNRCRLRLVPPPRLRPAFLPHPRLRRASPMSALRRRRRARSPRRRRRSLRSGEMRLGIVTCTLTGGISYSRRFYEEVMQDPATASPIIFPETVFNSCASHLAACLGSSAIELRPRRRRRNLFAGPRRGCGVAGQRTGRGLCRHRRGGAGMDRRRRAAFI